MNAKLVNEFSLGCLFNAISYSPIYALDQEDIITPGTANIPNGWAGFGNEIINPFSQIRDTYNSYFGSSIVVSIGI